MSDEEPFDWTDYASGGNDRPPIWKATTVGDSVGGRITEIWVFRKGDERTPVLNLETEVGPMSIWASQVLLRQAVADQDPQVGDTIDVEYVDNQPTKSGSGVMKVFDVIVRKVPVLEEVSVPEYPDINDDGEPF